MRPEPIGRLLRSPAFLMLARAALTCAYWWGGIAKLLDFPGALAEARHFGLEPAAAAVVATIIVEVGASILLILGRWSWLAAGALGVFTTLATLLAHSFWNISDPMERFHAMNTFLEHIGLIGGLALAAALAERERTNP